MWTPRQHLGELERVFVQMERRFDFLQKIDTEIVNPGFTFQGKFESLVQQFALRLIRADAVAVCFPTFSGGYSIQFLGEPSPNNDDLSIELTTLIPPHIAPGAVKFQKLPRNAQSNTAALLMALGFSTNDIFCVIAVLTTGISPKYSHLADPDVIQYATRVSAQLSVLLESEFWARNNAVQTRLIQSFFDARLDKLKVLTNCLEAIHASLPDWEPQGRSNNNILLQLLTYNGKEQPLTIQAQFLKTGNPENDNIGKLVLIGGSVCGTLVRDFIQDPVNRLGNIDPTSKKYNLLYKGFFGKTRSRSELMAVIANAHELVGILNLEHADVGYFSPAYERAVASAADQLAPFVKQLNATFELDQKRQTAHQVAMFGFLSRLTEAHRQKTHDAGSVTQVRLGQLKDHVDKADKDAHAKIDALAEKVYQYVDATSEFLKKAPYYISRGPVKLQGVVRDAMGEVQRFDREKRRFACEFECKGEPTVYASPMLQAHIFDLLNNSRQAIEKRSGKGQIKKGLIQIKAVTEDVEDDLGNKTAGARVRLQICDNGPGVEEQALSRILDYGYSTKGGGGYGLPAARDYVKSLGGELHCGNRQNGSGLIVDIVLYIFDPVRHRNEMIEQRSDQ
jgi:histidine kinase/DNA gyrase B/HSP90-like ATPase